MVLCDGIADEFLEEERALLEFGVHLAVDEDTRVEVLLGEIAEVLVLGHDAFVDLVYQVELLRGGVLIPEDLVLH